MGGGTAYQSRIPHIEICGKTGTVQNPHGDDHSVFFAFAPRHNPKIAIAVVVENGGHGSTWAAPIASLMIEKYLTDTITKPKYFLDYVLKGNLLPAPKIKPAAPGIEKKDKADTTSDKPKPKPAMANTKAILKND
jgi:penicillin-binding protein 2